MLMKRKTQAPSFRSPTCRPGRLLALVAVMLTSAPALLAQPPAGFGSIAGKVLPPHDHDMVLATARIPDLAQKVEVEADGTFRFASVRPGAHLLEIHVPSLGTAVERVEVRAGEETAIEIELKPGSHFEEIMVTAAADARDPLDLATPTTSLSGQELALRLESSLGETLAQEPGISSSFFGPGASRPIIRGMSGDRVRMLEGGLGTGDASAVSADHAVATDPAQAERIEVLRGPATLLYGSSAIGGAVNVIDERIPTSRATGASGSVALRAGSVAEERGGTLGLNGGSGDWAWHVDGARRRAEDYEAPSGTVPNTGLESAAGRVGVSRFFGDHGFIGIAVSGFGSEYGLPGGLGHGDEEEGDEEEEHGEEPVRIDLEQRRFDLRGYLNRPFGPFQGLKVRLGVTDYEHVELEGDEEGTFFFNDALEARVELIQQRRDRHRGSIGLQILDRDFEAVGEEAFLPETATERRALFTFQEIEAGALSWQLGARFESQDTDPATDPRLSRSHDGLSGSLGLVWQANEAFSIGASVSRSAKLPAAEELYSNGLHVASQAFEIGDPDLEEETSVGVDLSFRVEQERFSGELTLFRQDFDAFIFQAFTGDEEEGFPVVRYSQQDAEFSGLELKARLELFEHDDHHVHLRLLGDLVDAELATGGNLPRIPPLRLGAGLHYHSERWDASAEVRWIDAQTDVAANETPTAGYTLINANLGYRLLLRNQIVDLLLRGRNLGDELARSHTSFLKDIAPLPGRDLSLSVKFLF